MIWYAKLNQVLNDYLHNPVKKADEKDGKNLESLSCFSKQGFPQVQALYVTELNVLTIKATSN